VTENLPKSAVAFSRAGFHWRGADAYLFDIDGTLLRGAGHYHRQALVDGIRQVTGLSTHLDGVSTSGMLDRDLIEAMLKGAGHSNWRIRRKLRDIMHACQDAYCANCTLELRQFLCPGVPETLAALEARGAVLGLVTGNLSRIGWRKMELAALRDRFLIGAFAEDGRTRTRLARVARNRALKAGFVTRHARVSLIGDHPNDIRAARSNGFQSVAVATGLIGREELSASVPDILVESLRDLDLDAMLGSKHQGV
jgi:phosphoglycolate phosphatase